MTRYLLDTGVLQRLLSPEPVPPALAAWLQAQRPERLYLASWSVAALSRALLEEPPGRARDAAATWLTGAGGLQRLFHGRILPFDAAAERWWLHLVKAQPQRPAASLMPVAVAMAHDCRLVTDDRSLLGLDALQAVDV